MLTRDMLAAHDFTMVRAALIKELEGDAVAAIVLTRIHWRLSSMPDGSWWPASLERITAETGLGLQQVRRALERLIKGGYLESSTNTAGDAWHRTKSYRLVWDSSSHVASATEQVSPATVNSHDDVSLATPVPSSLDIEELRPPPTPPFGVSHLHEPNAQRALDTLHADRSLPLDVGELLSHAYRLGDGDPWEGYLQIKSRTEWKLGPSRDPAAVLRHRLLAEAAS